MRRATVAALAGAAFALACEGDPATAPGAQGSREPGLAPYEASAAFGGVIPLPYTDTVTSSVPAFEIKQKGGGIGGRFEITNPNSAAIALDGVSSGSGHALLAWNLGLGRGAVIITSNSSNTLPALDVSSQSLGSASTFNTLAAAMDVRANNTNSTVTAVQLSTLGKGPVLTVNHKGTAGALASFQSPMTDMLPLGVVGVIPTKVTAENGAIRRGDLLVTASSPGHAMLGTDRSRMLGAVIGKALEEFSGPGPGVIRVLVNVR